MNFEDIDIDQFLQAALPNRFQGITPQEFESFLARLFLDNGYHITETAYTGDFGADLLAEKENISTAVQIKRYHANNKVGVQEINQVLGAKQYYNCDAAMVITTSEYTPAASKLAVQTQILLWDWPKLLSAIEATYCEGQSYLDYFRGSFEIDPDDILLELSIEEVVFDEEEEELVVIADIHNHSGKNLGIYLDLPVCLTHRRRQIQSNGWVENSFQSGTIFNGASVEIACSFPNDQIEKLEKRDRLLIEVHISTTRQSLLLEAEFGSIKKGCFLITYAYGMDSEAYRDMRMFRDRYLATSRAGRKLIFIYYDISKRFIRSYGNRNPIGKVLGIFIIPLLKVIRWWIKVTSS